VNRQALLGQKGISCHHETMGASDSIIGYSHSAQQLN